MSGGNTVIFLVTIWIVQLLFTSSSKDKTDKPLKIAFCITGQLARLELKSKIKNIIAPNSKIGHLTHLFMYLDNEVDNVKQTFWKYDYSNTPYHDHTDDMMRRDLREILKKYKIEDSVKYWVKFEPPPQYNFQVVGEQIPVTDKIIKKPEKKMSGEMLPEGGIEKAEVRFQNNMRWLSALRYCVKWMQKEEYHQGIFYDLVVRLRDDTYAFGPWLLSYNTYAGHLVSAKTASFRGINDHNFVVDREFADDLFRGLTEDYYFNETLSEVMWGNPESRIQQLAEAYNIPIRNNTICDQPLIPLRGKQDDDHWAIHASYASRLLEECDDKETKRAGCVCNEAWIHLLQTCVVVIAN